jgi:HptB-dependent secretion and biofilm anti anti-sigma factor
MQFTISRAQSTTTVMMLGSLTFGDHKTFQQMIADVLSTKPQRVDFDLSGVERIDSAGLGLLVLLRNRLTSWHGIVALKHPPAQVARIFAVIDFSRLFEIVK